jgi:hypothetical protein
MDPKDEEGFRLSREAKQRDEGRIRRFEEVQRRKRNWIKFTEIAEEYSERALSHQKKSLLSVSMRSHCSNTTFWLATLRKTGARRCSSCFQGSLTGE